MKKRSALAKSGSVLHKAFLVIWAAAILASVMSYIAYPQAFTAENIAGFLHRFQTEIWIVYLAMSALRGLTLLPSTPLVLAGVLLFPDQPFMVLTVSITGIFLSSNMIYFFSDMLGFSSYFERHKATAVHSIKGKLEHPLGYVFVAAWAFLPFVPTDLVCYLAGITRMNWYKFVSAVMVGELFLCGFYVFFGGPILNYLR